MSTLRYPSYGPPPGSLISEITQHFTPEVVRSARSMIGESEPSTYKALQVAAPTVLSGMANMASSSEGANNLTNMIREGGNAGLSENLISLFRGGSATNYGASAGQRQLGKLFGGNTSSVMELVAKSGGVSTSSASMLMSLITPLTLGVVGKRMATEASGSSGLTDLLSRHRDEISAAAPSGLSRIVGFGPRVVPSPVRTIESEEVLDSPTYIEHFVERTPFADRPAPSRPRAGGGPRWLPFVILLLGALALLGYLLKRSREPRITDLGARGFPSVAHTVARARLPEGVNLSVPPGSVNYQLARFLGDKSATALPKTFVFEDLNFVSGSTQLTRTSDKTVSDLAQVLKAYPNAQVQLSGHTDNTGTPQSNQALSLDRANTIKAMLVNDGVGANRISTQGFGQERPIASNETEQGRSQNRRTELTVTQK